MHDLESALDDIARLREQLAASSRFQGLAPGVVALTGGSAFALGLWQYFSQDDNLIVRIMLAAICDRVFRQADELSLASSASALF